jgi:hypothetical protein
LGNIGIKPALGAHADPRQGELAKGRADVLDATATTAVIPEEEIVFVDVVATVETVAGPELDVRLARKDVADGRPGLRQADLGAGGVVVIRVKRSLWSRAKRWRQTSRAAQEVAQRLECVRFTGAFSSSHPGKPPQSKAAAAQPKSGAQAHALQTLARKSLPASEVGILCRLKTRLAQTRRP